MGVGTKSAWREGTSFETEISWMCNVHMLGKAKAKSGLVFAIVFLWVFGLTFTGMAKQKLSFWAPVGGTALDAMEEIIAEFQAMEPNVEIELVTVPWAQFDEKVLTAIASGTVPDLLYLDELRTDTYAPAGLLTDLRPYMDADPNQDFDDFFSGGLVTGQYQGTQYALPMTTAISGLYYNVDMVAGAGMEPPKTWEEYVVSTKKLTDPANKVWGTYVGMQRPGLAYDDRAKTFMAEFGVPGGMDLIDKEGKVVVNSKEAVDTLQFVVDLVYEHEVAPLPGAGFDMEIWGSGKVAMRPEWLWLTSWTEENFPDFKFAVTYLPAGPNGHHTFIGAHVIAMTKPSKNKDVAYKFMRYLTSTEALWSVRSDRLAARKSVAEHKVYAEHPAWSGFVKQLEYATWMMPETDRLTEVLSALGQQIDLAMYKKQTPGEALDEAAKRITSILNEK